MDNGVLVALLGLAGVALTAGVGLATGLATSRSQSRKTAMDTYSALVDDVQEWAEKRLAGEKADAEREQARLEARLTSLEKKYDNMKQRLDDRDRQLTDAVRHIWTLRALVPGDPPPPPESIADAVDRL